MAGPRTAPARLPATPRATALARTWHADFPTRGRGRIPAKLLEAAVDDCRMLSTPDGPEGLCNRDTHLGNIVAAEREPWLVIDVKPLLGERAVDAGFLIVKQVLTRPETRQARDAVAFTADMLDVDRARARAWALVRAVDDACHDPNTFLPAATALMRA